MASLLYYLGRRKMLLLSLLLFLFVSVCSSDCSEQRPQPQPRRRMFKFMEEEAEKEQVYQQPLKKKNQTKLIKPTKAVKFNKKTKNKSNSTSTKTITSSSSLDPAKAKKSKATKSTAATKEEESDRISKKKKPREEELEEEEEEEDFVSELKDLPMKFQQSLIPDLERISTNIAKANKEITKGFKPYVGNKYAASMATLLSCALVLIPLVLVSLLFNKIKAYFSLQKLLIFIQAYLAIYFAILSLSSFVTGLEPLGFFYSTSRSTYLCLQLLQTLAYALYLLLLIMYLVLLFSTDAALASRFLGLAQTFVGLSVGLHYYMTVFHRLVLKQPPKTSWKIHAVYATCFFLICLLAGAERRKKTYLEEGGQEGKKN
ncbi:hypothetical protein Fmac_013982 [Flemingia macrophylla]|uniref:Uncharacterized protein n=1 Tax=Flemingia macrophylla TaxID=520843 RepID=A0ABD1MAE5_9FABA